jgi:hypothetical protein
MQEDARSDLANRKAVLLRIRECRGAEHQEGSNEQNWTSHLSAPASPRSDLVSAVEIPLHRNTQRIHGEIMLLHARIEKHNILSATASA